MSVYARLVQSGRCDCATKGEPTDCPLAMEASVPNDEELKKLLKRYPHLQVDKVWRTE